MRQRGQVVRWNDERGFGFVVPEGSQREVFLHISALRRKGRRPQEGATLEFSSARDERGRDVAEDVVWPEDEARKPAGKDVSMWPLGAFALALPFLHHYWRFHPFWFVVYAGFSFLLFLFYAWDKSAAGNGGARTPEATLHFWALIGGWPGALLARKFLRHKSVKPGFRTVFWLTVIFNVAAFIVLTSPWGLPFLEKTLSGRL